MPYNDPPWHPITTPIDLTHLGKLGEELGELSAAVSRCIIQGLDSYNPDGGKPNHMWLEEEIADVLANLNLVVNHFKLRKDEINSRMLMKIAKLKTWHEDLNEKR